jgi:diadenosine tetraphosphatase ApaH/serine/threonine PP2A family protein phosphatase
MRVAVIADVHANAPALEAVLEAASHSGIDALVCLGDIIGYNAEPAACVEAVRQAADVVVAGNHDVDTVRSEAGAGTNSEARCVLEWTRRQLGPPELDYLSCLPAIVVVPGAFVAVHGCYLNGIHYSGYVTSTMLATNLRAIAAHGDWPRLALCGHTHVPMCGWLDGDDCAEPTFEGTLRWPADAAAVLLNPGSVGQPRDGDPRAAFAVLDLEAGSVELRRVPYDVERAVQAIRHAGLPDSLTERLRSGR